MDPQAVFRHNLDCPARGQSGKGNIGVHSRKDGRYICHVCRQTFPASKGTAFYWLRTPKDIVVIVTALLSHGGPPQAIVVALGIDERTVVSWQERAGEQCQRAHEHLVAQPRDLGQVQADEIRVKKQGGIVWIRKPGRPRLRAWDGLCIAQGIKQCVQRRLVGIERCVVQGTLAQMESLLRQTQSNGQVNVAYIERINATFRARMARLGTPWAGIGASTGALHRAMCLVGAVYNFCTYHKSLRTPIYLPGNRRRWARRTPAIAAGITDHLWTIEELLCFQVPLPPWRPPKRRGRPSASTMSLIARWCS